MKKFLLSILLTGLLCSCTSIEEFEPTIEARVQSGIQEGVVATVEKYTQIPSNTPYATYTAYPTLTPNPTYTPKIVVVTATFTSTPLYTPTDTLTPTETFTPTFTPDFRTQDRGDGFYLVNIDIMPGIWRSLGTQDDCYWEISDKFGDIIDNHFGMAGGTMYVASSAYQVMLEDCGTWTYLGE